MPDQVRHDRMQNLVSTVSVVVGLINGDFEVPPPLKKGDRGILQMTQLSL
jgi:hypothetical protein